MTKLFEVFGDFRASWPRFRINGVPGLDVPNREDVGFWLGRINNLTELQDVRFGASPDSVAMEARLIVLPDPDPLRVVVKSMPDVVFTLLATTTAAAEAPHVFVVRNDAGVEVVIDGLPVEIALPIGMVMPPATADGSPAPDVAVGDFTPGILDSRRVVYKESAPTLIRTHVRVSVDADLDVTVTPSVPISFGQCRFLGVPCVTVHEFDLIPQPAKAGEHVPWLRHDVTRWFQGVQGDVVGAFSVRSLRIDHTKRPLVDAADWLNRRTERHPLAQYVVEDLVLPFFSEMYLPVPRHVTVGIQRAIVDPNSLEQQFSFDRAPVNLHLSRCPHVHLLVNRLFYKSTAVEDVAETGPVTLEAVLLVGGSESGRNAMGITLEDEWTVLGTYLRDIDKAGAGTRILDWDLGGFHMSVVAVRVGVSFARLGAGRSFLDSFVLALDIAVRGDPASTSAVRLEGMDGAPVNFVVERVLWWFGLSAEGISLPDGVAVVLRVGRWKLRLIVTELGLVGDDNGGHYMFWTGGVDFDPPGGWDVMLTFRRLKKKVGGNPAAPEFAVEGFFLVVKAPGFEIDAGGYLRQERVGGDRVSETALGGSIQVGDRARGWKVAIEIIIGSVTGTRNFDYCLGMFAADFHVPCGPFELTSVRALYADDMQPALSDGDKSFGGLRYYQWYRRTDPTTVSVDRRLAGWAAREETWSLGLGAGASFPAFGKILDARVFILGVKDPEWTASMIAGEVRLRQNPTPIGYFIIEWDGRDDRLSILIGVDIRIDQFVRNPPPQLNELIRLTGTLLIRTNPAVVAIGRLRDPLTWLRFRFEIDLWLARSFLEVGFCFEVSGEGAEPEGTAFSLRAEGASWFGPGRVEFYVGFGWFIAAFRTGSKAFSIAVWVEGGLRFALFGFLNFGIHARADLRQTGPEPMLTTLALEVCIETPWFLPDVTFRIAETWGELSLGRMDTVVSPLTACSSRSAASEEVSPLFLFPQEVLAPPNGTMPVHSVEFVRGLVDPGRAARVSLWQNEMRAAGDAAPSPLATDAAVQLAFSVAVRDLVGIGSPPPAATAEQKAGDLRLVYEIIGFVVRRRPRFDDAGAWVNFVEREELVPVPDGAGGVSLTGSFDPMPLSGFWSPVLTKDGPAAMRLLLNSTTPFSFDTADAEADELLLEGNPRWPCCEPRKRRRSGLHVLKFSSYRLGDPLPPQVPFPARAGSLSVVRAADVVVSAHAGSTVPPGMPVMRQAGRPGHLFRVVPVAPAAWVDVSIGWGGEHVGAALVLVGSSNGEVRVRREVALGRGSAPVVVRLAAEEPLTEVRAWVETVVDADDSCGKPTEPWVEVHRVTYRTMAAIVGDAVDERLCDGVHAGGFSGTGKVGFLPNHEYELELRARVRVSHPTAGEEAAEYTQYAYFRTKGLPGLNAGPRVGAEVEPYVERVYPGAGGVLYRKEPVAIAFNEKFNVIVPLAARPAGPGSPERDVLLELALAVRPDVAMDPETSATASAPDWVVTHRASVPVLDGSPNWAFDSGASFVMSRTSLSDDPRVERLAELVLRPSAACPMPDPRLAPSGVLVHQPIGGGTSLDGSPLWPAMTPYTATVVVDGAPFVHRERFEPADLTAFTHAAPAAQWSVDDGVMRRAGTGRTHAVFGDPGWDHVVVEAGVSVAAVGGVAAGVGVAFPATGTTPGQSILALVERSDGGLALALHRTGGTPAAPVRASLPAETPVGSTVPLIVTVFDDVVRAAVGDVHVEVPRETRREGRVALVAEGACGFHSLEVSSLPLYRTTFMTSRYDGFEQHIHSFSGEVNRATPDDLAPGAATTTVPALRTATNADVARVMAPGAAAADRHAVFERWARELALPMRKSVDALEITRYERGGAVEALLLESPEPLRFSEEVTLTAARLHRSRVGGQRHPFLPELEGLVIEGSTARVDLPPGLAGRHIALVVVDESAGEKALRVLRGDAPQPSRTAATARLVVEETEVVRLRAVRRPTAGVGRGEPAAGAQARMDTVADELCDTPVGTSALVDLGKGTIIAVGFPWVVVPISIPVTILSDGPERRAVIVPAGAPAFTTGRHRLDFALSRARWTEVVPSNPLARYDASARLEITL